MLSISFLTLDFVVGIANVEVGVSIPKNSATNSDSASSNKRKHSLHEIFVSVVNKDPLSKAESIPVIESGKDVLFLKYIPQFPVWPWFSSQNSSIWLCLLSDSFSKKSSSDTTGIQLFDTNLSKLGVILYSGSHS